MHRLIMVQKPQPTNPEVLSASKSDREWNGCRRYYDKQQDRGPSYAQLQSLRMPSLINSGRSSNRPPIDPSFTEKDGPETIVERHGCTGLDGMTKFQYVLGVVLLAVSHTCLARANRNANMNIVGKAWQIACNEIEADLWQKTCFMRPQLLPFHIDNLFYRGKLLGICREKLENVSEENVNTKAGFILLVLFTCWWSLLWLILPWMLMTY